MALLTILAIVASVPSITVARTAEEEQAVVCPHPKGWNPADLPRILAKHGKWAERFAAEREKGLMESQKGFLYPAQLTEGFSQGRANLCNANLSDVQLTNADLTNADLRYADLSGADLTNADLRYAKLTNAHLTGAQLTNAHLLGADLTNAHLTGAQLTNAHLFMADLTNADLSRAGLDRADLHHAQLTNADLSYARLYYADLSEAQLTNANLSYAQLYWANLTKANVDRAHLHYAGVMGAIYAPASPPPDSYVAGIMGLQTVTFPKGEEIGLVQLRELIQKAGLRDLEREATYAIERGRTRYAHAAEGAFRFVFFEVTTDYGLHPARALIIIVVLWAALIMVYVWPIRLRSKPIRENGMYRSRQTDTASGIYRIWPKDRIEVHASEITADHPIKVEPLQGSMWTALGWAAYFSLLSAFHIGFREFNVGTWLARLQFHRFVLEPEGWVRFISGAQSLLSVYLLAIWALTYFGRPFQ